MEGFLNLVFGYFGGAFSVKALSKELLCEDSSIIENAWNRFQKLFSQMVVKNGDEFHGIPIR